MDWIIAAIAILTVIDIVCTTVGLSLGYITEANPVLARMYDWSLVGTCIIIFIFVLLLVMFINKYKHIKWVQYSIYGIIIVKLLVMLLHINWIMLVIN